MYTNYTRGATKEYQAKKELEKDGYSVIRASGSHGVFDLVAFNIAAIRFIQVKRQKASKSGLHITDYKADLESIRNIPVPFTQDIKVSKELWVWLDKKGWNKNFID